MFAFLLILASLSAAGQDRSGQQKPALVATPESTTHFRDSVRPMLEEFCGDCHAEGEEVDFLVAETAEDMERQRGVWKSVSLQLRNRTMPPVEEAQPSEADRLRIAAWVEEQLRQSACNQGEFAGSVLPRRLNRNEYNNTIRDLLGIDLELSESFPADGSGGEGFDNNGETLFISPLLMERYLDAAEFAMSQVIVPPKLDVQIPANDLLPRPDDQSSELRLLNATESLTAIIRVFADGEHTISFDVSPVDEKQAIASLVIDGIPADELKIDAAKSDQSKTKPIDVKVHLTRGMHAIGLQAGSESRLKAGGIEVSSRVADISAEQSGNHRRLLGVLPGEAPENADREARSSIERFASAAFRREATDQEIDQLMKLYKRSAKRGDPYEESLRLALKTVLISPQFLFRLEQQAKSSEIEPINDFELATRLSYFLNATMPDQDLLKDAKAGKLKDESVLRSHVDRLLAKPETDTFCYEFVGQWLGTREVSDRVIPLPDKFKDQYTTPLLRDMRREPVELFAHLVREDRSLLELIDSDYLIVSGQLAKHYGLLDSPKIKDSDAAKHWKRGGRNAEGDFRQIPAADHRGGLVGMGGVHLLTSYPDRTSPVLRGGWILETLLGVRVPSPPPEVPELKRNKDAKTIREQLEMHRDHEACAACHNLMDPLGFALDNFDVLGRWREEENKGKINASAKLPSGEEFVGPEGLRLVLMKRKDEVMLQLTRKMLGYALGRSLDDRDDCTVNRIAEKLKTSDYRARVLIQEIVLSTPFRFRQQVELRTRDSGKSVVEKRIEIQRKKDR